MAYKDGLLSEVEYHIFDKWYNWISGNTDIGLDLIGNNKKIKKKIHVNPTIT
jgi:hypothetical protein